MPFRSQQGNEKPWGCTSSAELVYLNQEIWIWHTKNRGGFNKDTCHGHQSEDPDWSGPRAKSSTWASGKELVDMPKGNQATVAMECCWAGFVAVVGWAKHGQEKKNWSFPEMRVLQIFLFWEDFPSYTSPSKIPRDSYDSDKFNFTAEQHWKHHWIVGLLSQQ